jgi:ABC-type amino acid transport system permease subunit
MYKVIFPQAFRIVIPPYLNGLITLAKDTSLVSAITVTELTLTAQRAYASSFRPLEILTVATILYLILTSMLMVAQQATERRLRLPGSVASFRDRRTQGHLA